MSRLSLSSCALAALALVAAAFAHPAGADELPRGKWSDLVARIDLDQRGAVGAWKKADPGIAVAAGDKPARLPIPVVPGTAYRVKVEFTRTEGDGTVGVIVPVGARQCLVAVNFNGGPSGIDTIDGRRADNNASSFAGPLTNGRRYALEVSVKLDGKEASVTATLDDRPLVFYQGPAAALGLHKDWAVAQKNVLGLAAGAGATFHKVQIRPVSGAAKGVK